jgi:aminomethyltransferase
MTTRGTTTETPPGSTTDPAAAQRTPLHDAHVALGATLTDFAGWSMPLRYTSDLAEHHAVRTTAGLFDLSHMGEIGLTGPQAGDALNHALVGDLAALAIGRAKYSLICAPDGGILDDLVVYRTGFQEFLVVANAANAKLVDGELLTRAADFDAVVTDRSTQFALLALQGPVATEVLGPLTEVDLGAVKYYAGYPGTVAGVPVLLARTGYTGEDGYELFCDPRDAPRLWTALLEAGASAGVQSCGLACRDSLRLEAGMPLYGNELDTTTTPYAAGLGRSVALDKAEFIGRDALQAASQEPPRRVRVGLVARGRRAPRHGYPVIDPSTGEQVGAVTSGAPSPTLGRPIAMAYVDTRCAETGTELQVQIRGALEAVEVVSLPFYRRAK